MADALRNNMDAAENKQVVLKLIFLKYISGAFEAKHPDLDSEHMLTNPPFNDSDCCGELLVSDKRLPYEAPPAGSRSFSL